MKKLALIGISLLLLTGAFGDKVKKLEPGMAREQVIKLLGRPDGVRRYENVEALTYVNRSISNVTLWTAKTDYVVVLKDGVVSEYGPGTIRVQDPNVGAFIFVPL